MNLYIKRDTKLFNRRRIFHIYVYDYVLYTSWDMVEKETISLSNVFLLIWDGKTKIYKNHFIQTVGILTFTHDVIGYVLWQ